MLKLVQTEHEVLKEAEQILGIVSLLAAQPSVGYCPGSGRSHQRTLDHISFLRVRSSLNFLK